MRDEIRSALAEPVSFVEVDEETSAEKAILTIRALSLSGIDAMRYTLSEALQRTHAFCTAATGLLGGGVGRPPPLPPPPELMDGSASGASPLPLPALVALQSSMLERVLGSLRAPLQDPSGGGGAAAAPAGSPDGIGAASATSATSTKSAKSAGLALIGSVGDPDSSEFKGMAAGFVRRGQELTQEGIAAAAEGRREAIALEGVRVQMREQREAKALEALQVVPDPMPDPMPDPTPSHPILHPTSPCHRRWRHGTWRRCRRRTSSARCCVSSGGETRSFACKPSQPSSITDPCSGICGPAGIPARILTARAAALDPAGSRIRPARRSR